MEDRALSFTIKNTRRLLAVSTAAIIMLLGCLVFCHEATAINYTNVRAKLVKTIHLERVNNGTTITSEGNKKYFIYTDGTFYGATRFYRCNWPQLTGCTKFLESNTGHSNVVDAPWTESGPPRNFWVYGSVSSQTPRWCVNSLTGRKSGLNPSTCGGAAPSPASLDSASGKNGRGSGDYTQDLTQDLTKYGKYTLRVYGGFNGKGGNIIEVRKNNHRRATLRPVHASGTQVGNEAEGVFVDGDTGTIYFTVIRPRVRPAHDLLLYKVTGYTLPVLTKETNNSSGSSSGRSSGSSPSRTSGPSSGGSTSSPASNTGKQNQSKVDDNCVQTSIIQTEDGKYCDDGKGGGVYAILNIILTVLTFGIGIAATAGLIISGIQYATSGTNEARATQARRRIFEIVIGLIAYALLYLALQWLIPNFG
ncbi:hypothetical protein IJ101_02665 [Candidatus Saccharibacteria bacterium]|nr:hypothetical protein [Candidatus Saccharibacteria bacterium]